MFVLKSSESNAVFCYLVHNFCFSPSNKAINSTVARSTAMKHAGVQFGVDVIELFVYPATTFWHN